MVPDDCTSFELPKDWDLVLKKDQSSAIREWIRQNWSKMETINYSVGKSIEKRMYCDFKSFLDSIGCLKSWQNSQRRHAIQSRCSKLLKFVGLVVVDPRPEPEQLEEAEFRQTCLAYWELFNGEVKSRLGGRAK